jgi:hypothetical protein
MIRAVVSDFGGVLTTPIAGSFQAFADRSGITLATMGQTLEALHERDGTHPLHELECGRISAAAFASSLQRALCDAAGHEVSLVGFAELLGDLLPNERMIALMALLRDEGYRMALLTNNVREWEQRWRAMARRSTRSSRSWWTARSWGCASPIRRSTSCASRAWAWPPTSACSWTTARTTAWARLPSG